MTRHRVGLTAVVMVAALVAAPMAGGQVVLGVDFDAAREKLITDQRARIARQGEVEAELQTLESSCNQQRKDMEARYGTLTNDTERAAMRDDAVALQAFCAAEEAELTAEHRKLGAELKQYKVDDPVGDRLIEITRERIAMKAERARIETTCSDRIGEIDEQLPSADNATAAKLTTHRASFVSQCAREHEKLDERSAWLDVEEHLLEAEPVRGAIMLRPLADARKQHERLVQQGHRLDDDRAKAEAQCDAQRAQLDGLKARVGDQHSVASRLFDLEAKCAQKLGSIDEQKELVDVQLDALSIDNIAKTLIDGLR